MRRPRRTSLFGNYKCTASVESTSTTAQRVLHQYPEAINDNGAAEEAEQVIKTHSDATLTPLFSLVLCVPESSAPVYSACLIVMPNPAKMSNSLLENLMFLK